VATFDRDLALGEETFLVIGMDGGPLPAEMGRARMLAPGQATKYQVKFVKRITAK